MENKQVTLNICEANLRNNSMMQE